MIWYGKVGDIATLIFKSYYTNSYLLNVLFCHLTLLNIINRDCGNADGECNSTNVQGQGPP